MEFTDLINGRESIRSYDPDRPLSDEVLQKILDAGRVAPSAGNKQPWTFIVASSKDALEKIRPCYPAPWFYNAPHVLIVVVNRSESWHRKNHDNYCSLETDATIAMDHMILAAENEGVGTCWIAAFDPGILRTALELDLNHEVFAITPLGYTQAGYKKHGDKKRKSLKEITKHI